MAMARGKFPSWLRRRIVSSPDGERVRRILSELALETVCRNAHCPNLHECYARGTATFLLMGRMCTRSCRFCAVEHGEPPPLDANEPERIAEAVVRLALRHVVLTSVTRDDLPDGGAEHFAKTIRAIRRRSDAVLEVLTPDFGGQLDAVDRVLDAGPQIFNHNVETVPRLYSVVRPQAVYERSLAVLEHAARRGISTPKSGFMVGLGESHEEVLLLMRDLNRAGVMVVTIGQYLSPSPEHLPVERFVPPEEFEELAREGGLMGFAAVYAGPFVRSSYNALEVYQQVVSETGRCDTK